MERRRGSPDSARIDYGGGSSFSRRGHHDTHTRESWKTRASFQLRMAQPLLMHCFGIYMALIRHPRHTEQLHGAPSFAVARATCTAYTIWRGVRPLDAVTTHQRAVSVVPAILRLI